MTEKTIKFVIGPGGCITKAAFLGAKDFMKGARIVALNHEATTWHPTSVKVEIPVAEPPTKLLFKALSSHRDQVHTQKQTVSNGTCAQNAG